MRPASSCAFSGSPESESTQLGPLSFLASRQPFWAPSFRMAYFVLRRLSSKHLTFLESHGKSNSIPGDEFRNGVFQVSLVVKPASYTVSSVGTIYTSLLYLTYLHAAHVVLKDNVRLHQKGSKGAILLMLS